MSLSYEKGLMSIIGGMGGHYIGARLGHDLTLAGALNLSIDSLLVHLKYTGTHAFLLHYTIHIHIYSCQI